VTHSSSLTPAVLREPEGLEPPFSAAIVEELLRSVSKAARARQLYLPNNPMYRSAIDGLRTAFSPIWKETDEISLAISESEIRWFDAPVSRELGGAKSPDNLAWLFYKDGVRELTLTKGFEKEEVIKLLEIIQRARKGSAEEDDLVTMFWEADFAFLQYGYVDLLHEGGAGDLADGTDVRAVSTEEIQHSTAQAVEESRASGVVDLGDFDATLYFLDQPEIEYLESEIRREYQLDLRINVASILFDIFEAQTDASVRNEVLEHVHTLLVYLLTAEHFSGVTYVLREAQTVLQRATNVTDDQRQLLARLPERLSDPEALSQLLQALDDTPSPPPQSELNELFDQLRPTALATVFQWLSRTQNESVRPLLESAAGRLASANTSELVRLIQSTDPDVSAEAIRRAGSLKTQAAVGALGKIIATADIDRRRLAVQALSGIGSAGAMQALERTIEDSDRDVRVTAVRAFKIYSYRPALTRLEAAVKGKPIREVDLTEKMAFFETYGSLCGDTGVPHLDAILNGKGFLGRRDDAEMRACAAIALGYVATTAAMTALRKAASEKDIVVRNAVNRALRGPGGAEL
jgi:hypothetical protein